MPFPVTFYRLTYLDRLKRKNERERGGGRTNETNGLIITFLTAESAVTSFTLGDLLPRIIEQCRDLLDQVAYRIRGMRVYNVRIRVEMSRTLSRNIIGTRNLSTRKPRTIRKITNMQTRVDADPAESSEHPRIYSLIDSSRRHKSSDLKRSNFL